MKTRLLLIASFLIFLLSANGQNCSAPSPADSIPINDLGAGSFTNAWGQVWMGGLYMNGSNYMPASHKSAGMQMAQSILPRNLSGAVDIANGKIVWLSIGMSNTTREARAFIPLANAYPNINPKLTLVDGAKSGQDAAIISSPWNAGYANYWTYVSNQLSNAQVSANQVQVIWFKEADQTDAGTYTTHSYYDSLVVQFTRIMHELKTRFPNAKLCYVAPRVTARYATTNHNPEPFAYYTGYADREIIQRQINGDTAFAYSGTNPRSPFLLWGMYWWSNGNRPQQTNPAIYLNCTDFDGDGTHPSNAVGAPKVAAWLLHFYQNDSLSCSWFFKNPPASLCGTVTGINEMAPSQNSLKAYPNPFTDHVVLETGKLKAGATITIVNQFGQAVKELKDLHGQTFIIYRGNLPAGIYYARIINGSQILTAKLFIAR